MPHWREYMDEKEFLYAFNLKGKDVTLTLKSVSGGKIGWGKNASKKPVAQFEGTDKKLALNTTNCKTIAGLYGNDTTQWVGKRITLYPATTQMEGETRECIRVRPVVPQRKGKEQVASHLDGADMPSEQRADGEQDGQ